MGIIQLNTNWRQGEILAADFCAYIEKIKILCYNSKNCTMQPAVDEFQVVVWWYATCKKVILGSSDGDTPPAFSSGGIEK